jgi:DNA-binding transcriptional MerR regulator
MADEPGYRLQELVERSGLPARTIRWYQSEGLLPKPGKHGRDAVYSDEHLERLALIAELRDRGLTLVAIRDLVQRSAGGHRRRVARCRRDADRTVVGDRRVTSTATSSWR